MANGGFWPLTVSRLGDTLKQYYPQALEWFEQRDTILFCDFICRWPALAQAKRAHTSTLESFFKAHNVLFKRIIDARIESIKKATPLTLDIAVISTHRLQTLALIEQLRVTLQAIDLYEDEIASLAPTLPDYVLFSTLPGAGPSLALRLLAKRIGAQVEEVEASHVPFLTQPKAVADVIDRAAWSS